MSMPSDFSLPLLPFRAAIGVAHTTNGTYALEDLAATLTPQASVEVTGICPDFLRDSNPTVTPVDVTFTTPDGWHVEVQRGLVANRSFPTGRFRIRATAIHAEQGVIREVDNVTMYWFVTGLPEGAMSGERRPGDKHFAFTAPDLASLALAEISPDEAPSISPPVTGYFRMDGSFAQRSAWDDLFGRLYNLLALASSNFVGFPFRLIIGPAGRHFQLRTLAGETGRGSSVLYLQLPLALSRFLNSTYNQYIKWRHVLDLDTLIHYYVMLKNTHYTETRILLGSVFMEGIKYAYAANRKQYQRDSKGFFLQQLPNGKSKRYTFDELLGEVYAEFGLTHGDTRFIEYRNEVVHQGRLTSLTWDQIKVIANDLERTIEHLLLRILAYQGDYWDTTQYDPEGRPGVWVDFTSVVA